MSDGASGIGAPAASAALALVGLADILSGIGDVLFCFARSLESLGPDHHAELIGRLDLLILQCDNRAEAGRAMVARSLRDVLLRPEDYETPGRRLRVVDGGRCDPPPPDAA